MGLASGLSSKRSSIASIASLSSSRKSSLPSTPDDSPEGRIASVVAHFSDPDLVIASTEADAALDKGYLRGWAGGYGGGNGRKSALTEGERFWLTRQCIDRFLDATKGDVSQAIQRLKDTLIWRRSFGINELFEEPDAKEEAARGKHFYCGYDVTGHLCHYVVSSSVESKGPDQQIRHAIWFAEIAPVFFKPGQGALTLLVDFNNPTSNRKPSLATARQSLSIMQSHYPNRLHKAYFRNLSPIMSAFIPLTYPFMDPKTAAKIHIEQDPLQQGTIDAQNLLREWGGENTFSFKHPEYYHELNAAYEKVMAERLARWRTLGGVVGEDEFKFFEGEVQSS
ncbi:hypothetical protein QFC22_004876 [Naganishia vaughanmartiniae]|uniref:Uncharacterized protein n=1 Tax=Naganishia vaughanmartiniae TaxID=1424756 RepID=A0ACC2WZ31_9TREE|nr:hypothetical protein QFC22_004876 [Naganishia vaughanmartiniae]